MSRYSEDESCVGCGRMLALEEQEDICRACARRQRARRNNGRLGQAPAIELLLEWEHDGICEATDGCPVSRDGRCEHGKVSWLRMAGAV